MPRTSRDSTLWQGKFPSSLYRWIAAVVAAEVAGRPWAGERNPEEEDSNPVVAEELLHKQAEEGRAAGKTWRW